MNLIRHVFDTVHFLFKKYFWLLWVFVAACRLPLIAETGVYPLVAAHGLVASPVAEYTLYLQRLSSCCWLQSTGSVVLGTGLVASQHVGSSQAEIQLVSRALAGRFFNHWNTRSDQSLSCVRLFATPWIAAHQASLSITNSQSSLRLTSIKSVMPSIHLILCRPLLLLPPIPASIRVFSNESTLCMRWPKYWSFSFSIIPSKEIPGLISFRMDCLDLLAVQGTHHNSKASILRHSAFFTVQLSYPYMTTGKTIALSSSTLLAK